MGRNYILKAYLCTVGLLAAVITYRLGLITTNSFNIDLFFFIVLLLANNRRSIQTESGTFSLNYPLLLPVMAFHGPLMAAITAALGVIELDEFKDPLPVIVHNRGTIALSAVLGGMVFQTVNTQHGFTLAVAASARRT